MKICGPVERIFGQALSILKSTSAKVLREVAKKKKIQSSAHICKDTKNLHLKKFRLHALLMFTDFC